MGACVSSSPGSDAGLQSLEAQGNLTEAERTARTGVERTATHDGNGTANAMSRPALWEWLFNHIDENKDGLVKIEEITLRLQGESSLTQARGRKLRALSGAKDGVKLEKFAQAMEELFFVHLNQFFIGCNLPSLLARTMLELIASSPALQDECKHLHPFQFLKTLGTPERARIAEQLLERVFPVLVSRLADGFAAAAAYEVQEEAEAGKFLGTMELGHPRLFDMGVDFIGAPDYDFERGLAREHASEEKFTAWNNDELRETSPAEQLRKALPEGWDGPVNNRDYHGNVMCEDVMAHPRARAADLCKAECVALKLYTGPMYKIYNGLLRHYLKLIKAHLAAAGSVTGSSIRSAAASARKELGRQYVTTTLVLASALQKLRTVDALPEDRKVYRGVAGMQVPECFQGEDELGNRGGVEFGFLSTSTSKEQAIGYISFAKGMPQLYEMDVGQIDRGADLSWISYFPAEAEVLLPPLCGLEVVGDARFVDVPVTRRAEGAEEVREEVKVMVWQLRLNANLQSKTIDEMRAVRKNLHSQMAENAMAELEAMLALPPGRAGVGEREGPTPTTLEATCLLQCEAVVERYKQRTDAYFNSDAEYSAAIQDLLAMKPWASALVAMRESGVASAEELLQLPLQAFLPSAQAGASGGVAAAAALQVCKARALVQTHVEEIDARGRTPLICAGERGAVVEVRLLLQARARVEAADPEGGSALHAAARGGSAETAAALLDAGCGVAGRGSQARTALHAAAEGGSAGVARLLLERGAAVDEEDAEGQTALHRAAACGCAAAAVVLLRAGGSVDARDKHGSTPLHCAAAGGSEGVCMALLAAGATPHARTLEQQTPLHVVGTACTGESAGQVAQLLVKAGARFDERDQRGQTPLDRARAAGRGDGVVVLERGQGSAGAEVQALSGQNAGPSWAGKKFYYEEGKQKKGPVAFAALKTLFDSEVVGAGTRVWCKELGKGWSRLHEIPELLHDLQDAENGETSAAAGSQRFDSLTSSSSPDDDKKEQALREIAAAGGAQGEAARDVMEDLKRVADANVEKRRREERLVEDAMARAEARMLEEALQEVVGVDVNRQLDQAAAEDAQGQERAAPAPGLTIEELHTRWESAEARAVELDAHCRRNATVIADLSEEMAAIRMSYSSQAAELDQERARCAEMSRELAQMRAALQLALQGSDLGRGTDTEGMAAGARDDARSGGRADGA